jgi:hypothetical protein
VSTPSTDSLSPQAQVSTTTSHDLTKEQHRDVLLSPVMAEAQEDPGEKRESPLGFFEVLRRSAKIATGSRISSQNSGSAQGDTPEQSKIVAAPITSSYSPGLKGGRAAAIVPANEAKSPSFGTFAHAEEPRASSTGPEERARPIRRFSTRKRRSFAREGTSDVATQRVISPGAEERPRRRSVSLHRKISFTGEDPSNVRIQRTFATEAEAHPRRQRSNSHQKTKTSYLRDAVTSETTQRAISPEEDEVQSRLQRSNTLPKAISSTTEDPSNAMIQRTATTEAEEQPRRQSPKPLLMRPPSPLRRRSLGRNGESGASTQRTLSTEAEGQTRRRSRSPLRRRSFARVGNSEATTRRTIFTETEEQPGQPLPTALPWWAKGPEK